MLKLQRFTAVLLVTFIIMSITGCNLIEKEEKVGKEINGEVMVASVNKENITKAEYDRVLEDVQDTFKAYYGEEFFSTDEGKEVLEQIKEKLLEDFIIQKIILTEASNMDISVTAEEIDKLLEQLIEDYGGQEQFDKLIEERGIDLDNLKQDFHFQLTAEKLMEEVTKEVEINNKEIREYYENNPDEFKEFPDEVKARHILVDDEDEAKKLLEQLKNGADFAELAKQHSKDPGSKDEGGDLGYFNRGAMVAEFDEAVFNMEVGEISDIVKTRYGYHIIKLEEKTIGPVIKFAEIEEELKEQLLLNKKYEEFDKQVSEWRKAAKVKKYI